MDPTPSADDRDSLERLSRGDLAALGDLYDRYSAPVYHLLLARTRDPEASQDLLQETFLALVERGAAAARIRSPRAYLLAVAHHLSTRRRRREATLADAEAESADGLGAIAAEQALAALPPEQATIVALKVWHDLTFAEIGAALRVPPNTAASRYRYGLEKLRRLMGDDDHA